MIIFIISILLISACSSDIDGDELIGEKDITFDLSPTEKAGEIEFNLQAQLDEGIEMIRVETSEDYIVEEFDNEETINLNDIIAGNPGTESEINLENVSLKITTGEGDTFTKTEEQYVRKYDLFESESDIDIGVMYWPFMEPHWENNSIGEPLIGPYILTHEEFEHKAVSRHIDQMQSSGISRMSLLFGQTEYDVERYENFDDVELIDEINLEIEYDIDKVIKRDLDVDKHMEFFRNKMIARDNYYCKDGRPMFFFWASHSLAEGEHREKVEDRWGGPAEFIQYIRSELTVNGVEPYMVGDFQHIGHAYYHSQNIDDQLLDIIKEFDAVTTWTGHNKPYETIDWEEQYEFVKYNFKGYEMLTNNYNIEFAPRAFPGFDDRGNYGWGEDRLTPPDPDYFAELLELASEYKTIDYINIASWSEWAEGHMIEPGYYFDYEEYPYYDDAYYGFDYLDEIKNFLDN